MAAADTVRPGGGSADSYIGSLISLMSKCEIRYEGVLYNINTDESSIGLRNVRSYGTEGRKKDGPQIPPSDKIYEYILFRGSDIKDLQVKSSPPPAQPAPPPAPPLHNDPAIIQSHYPRPTASATMPSIGGATGADLTGQGGILRTGFQGNLPLYQPGGSLGSWGSSPALPTANGSGFGMPMYWQGYYAPSGGLPHLQQPALLRPPPGLQMPQNMQQPLQYPGISVQLPSLPPNLSSGAPNVPGSGISMQIISSTVPEVPSFLPPMTGTVGLTSTAIPSTSAPIQAAPLASEISQTPLPNRTLVPTANIISSIPLETPLVSKPESIVEPVFSKSRATPGPRLTYQTVTQAPSTNIGFSGVSQGEVLTSSLVTPGQLLQSGTSMISSSQPLQTGPKAVEVKTSIPEPSKEDPVQLKEQVFAESKEPILPTPPDRKISGTSLQTHGRHNSRGRIRGRGNGYSRPVTKFTEEFDFTAMNEKFNKDEVWGHLGKVQDNAQEREAYINVDDDYDIEEEDYAESSKTKIKSGYVKDDFFDSLSCNALDKGGRIGRTKFSEQLKIDAETFGDLSKHRLTNHGGRGGRGFRGGRTGGSLYGRGYGYAGRGRGRGRGYPAQNWAS